MNLTVSSGHVTKHPLPIGFLLCPPGGGNSILKWYGGASEGTGRVMAQAVSRRPYHLHVSATELLDEF